MKWRYLILPLLSVFLLSGCTPHVNLNAPFGSRPPNPHEMFFTAVAADFHDVKMCEKISGRALDERGPDMGSSDWRVNSQRSSCYFYLAITTKDGTFCKFVKDIVTLPSNHSEISSSKCMEMIRQNQQSSYHPDAGDYALPGLMQEMGYRDEDRYEAQYKENIWNNPAYGFYAKVKNNSDFKSRVRDLPSYAESYSPGNHRRANEDELMTAMLVVEDAIPATCEKNSPNSYAESHANLYSDIVSKGAVRNSCFSAIAFDTRVPALCAKIIPVEGNLPELNYVDRENCEDGIRVAIQNNEKLLSHNPQYFSRMDDFVGALRKLVIDQNAPDWSAFYRHLMYYAKPGEKQEFLRRAEALPSFTK